MNLDYKKLTFSWIDENKRKEFLCIQSKRKSNCRIRLYNNLEKEFKDRLKKENSKENKNTATNIDMNKTNKDFEIISNNNIHDKICLDLKNIKNNKTINTFNSLNNNINQKDIENNFSHKNPNDQNIEKLTEFQNKCNQTFINNSININPQNNSNFNNQTIINNYEIKTINTMPIQIIKKNNVLNIFHQGPKENSDNYYTNNNIKKNLNIYNHNYFPKVEELHLSNNTEYKSQLYKKDINNSINNNNYIKEINNFSNSQRYKYQNRTIKSKSN